MQNLITTIKDASENAIKEQLANWGIKEGTPLYVHFFGNAFINDDNIEIIKTISYMAISEYEKSNIDIKLIPDDNGTTANDAKFIRALIEAKNIHDDNFYTLADGIIAQDESLSSRKPPISSVNIETKMREVLHYLAAKAVLNTINTNHLYANKPANSGHMR